MQALLSFSLFFTPSLLTVNGAVSVSVNLIDHVLKFSFRGVLSKGAHNCAELLGGDGAVTILVEQGEGLLELGDLSEETRKRRREGEVEQWRM